MRGSDAVGRALLLRRSGEAGAVGSSAAARSVRLVNETLEALIGEFDALYSAGTGGRRSRRRCCCGRCCCRRSTTIRSERQLMERLEFDLLVPLVRRALGGRAGLGPFDLLEEPRPAAGRRDRREVPRRGAGPAQGEAAAVEPALQRRRDPDRGLGEPEVRSSPSLARPGERAVRPRTGPVAKAIERAGATRRSTSRARSARTRRTARPPIPRRCSTARGRAWRRSSASSATG